MTVTKQQQLEWLASMWTDAWVGSTVEYVDMSVLSIGVFCTNPIYQAHRITREEWRQERDNMNSKPEVDNSWHERGEMPPVGSTFEKKYKSATIWTEIKIVAAGNQLVIFGYPDGDESVGEWSDYEFRPLRTEREKAIDDMKSLCAYPGSWCSTFKAFAESLYDAGYRKVSQ